MADSSDIDNALVAKLGSDSALMAICTNLVYMNEAPPGMTKFVIVSLVDEVDEPKFGGLAYEDALYMVKAVIQAPNGVPVANIKSAAARIHVLLEDQMLSVSGYTWMTMHRESRIRVTEVDEVDPTMRWEHRGGMYRVQMSL